MKQKDKQLLKTQNLSQLNLELNQSLKNLVKLKMDLKTNKLKDTSQLKKTRYKISFIKTLISSKL